MTCDCIIYPKTSFCQGKNTENCNFFEVIIHKNTRFVDFMQRYKHKSKHIARNLIKLAIFKFFLKNLLTNHEK